MKKLPLVGLTEIAQRAGVQKPVVSGWRTRYTTFPAPVADLTAGPVFWWPQVQAWLKGTGRVWDAEWTLEEVNASARRVQARQAGPDAGYGMSSQRRLAENDPAVREAEFDPDMWAVTSRRRNLVEEQFRHPAPIRMFKLLRFP